MPALEKLALSNIQPMGNTILATYRDIMLANLSKKEKWGQVRSGFSYKDKSKIKMTADSEIDPIVRDILADIPLKEKAAERLFLVNIFDTSTKSMV
jgi:hypothetical protein